MLCRQFYQSANVFFHDFLCIAKRYTDFDNLVNEHFQHGSVLASQVANIDFIYMLQPRNKEWYCVVMSM